MNKYVESLGKGLAIGVGISLVLAIFIYIQSEDEDELYVPKYKELDTGSVTVLSSRLITLSERVRISVKLRNPTELNLEDVWIVVRLLDKEGLFGECNGSVKDLMPNHEQETSVVCHDFKSRDLPTETTIKVRISKVLVLNNP